MSLSKYSSSRTDHTYNPPSPMAHATHTSPTRPERPLIVLHQMSLHRVRTTSLHILPKHTPPLSRTILLRPQTALTPLMPPRLNHWPRTRSPQTRSLRIIPKRICRLHPTGSMHLLIIPLVQLPLPRSTASPVLGNPANTNTTVPTIPTQPSPAPRILQPELLLLIPSPSPIVISLVPYPRIPRLVRIQRTETSMISTAGSAVGSALIRSASRALVAQRIDLRCYPALDPAGCRCRRAVGCWVAVAAICEGDQ